MNDLTSYSRGNGEAELEPGDEGLRDRSVVAAADAGAPLGKRVPSDDALDCSEGCSPSELEPGEGGATDPGSAPADAVDGAKGEGGIGDDDDTAGNETMSSDAGRDAPAASACGAGALEASDGRCFALIGAVGTWEEARQGCASRGAGWDLATIRAAERNEWLAGVLGELPDAWLGASDQADEGTWLWLGDVEAFWIGAGSTGGASDDAYENWNAGENPEPNGGGGSDCLRMRAGGGWADTPCDSAVASLCEGPLAGAP